MRKVILGSLIIIAVAIIVFLINFDAQSSEDEGSGTKEESVSGEVQTKSDKSDEVIESEFETKAKALVENQFEYFDSIVNSDFFIESRQKGPDAKLSDSWMTEAVKEDIHQKAIEIHKLLPKEMDGSNPVAQDLLQVLIRINQATSLLESQKNIYHIHKILYDLNVTLNGYELGNTGFDPKNDWISVFGEEEEAAKVLTEEELEAMELEGDEEVEEG